MTDTSIRIESDVRDRLKARGQKGETYSEIIVRLLDETATNENDSNSVDKDHQQHTTNMTTSKNRIERMRAIRRKMDNHMATQEEIDQLKADLQAIEDGCNELSDFLSASK